MAVLGAFLAFFPVAVGTLRGLESAPATSLELMRSYAASGWQTMFKLRFPAPCRTWSRRCSSPPPASVIGVVVAEISTGLRGGIGRLIIEYATPVDRRSRRRCTRPCFGAAVLGLAMAGLVVGLRRAC